MFWITFCRLLVRNTAYLVAGLIFVHLLCVLQYRKDLCLKRGQVVLPQNFLNSIHTKWYHFMQ